MFCRNVFMLLIIFNFMKRGQSEQFNWVFVLVAGAIILGFFVMFVFKYQDLQQKKLSVNVGKILDENIKLLETTELYLDDKEFDLGLRVKIDFYCQDQENFFEINDYFEQKLKNIVLFFQGKKSKLAKVLEKEMNEYVKKNEFEKANEMKKTLYALNHIQDISLIKSEKTINSSNKDNFRIEAYDIAHMSGKDTVGVMVVIKNGEINKNQYRKFKIKIDKNDDVAGLKEILNRRLQHTEWEFPDLIVIDGGINQLNIVRSIIKDIPIVSIVKDNNHRPDHFLGNKKIIEENKKLILIANNEAHRFAITYHKKLRSKNFL